MSTLTQEDFNRQVQDYIQIDNYITETNKKLKDLKGNRSLLEDSLTNYMTVNNIGKVDLSESGNLRLAKTKKASKKLSKKEIISILLHSLEDEKAHTLIDEIYPKEDETEEEIIKLERSKK